MNIKHYLIIFALLILIACAVFYFAKSSPKNQTQGPVAEVTGTVINFQDLETAQKQQEYFLNWSKTNTPLAPAETVDLREELIDNLVIEKFARDNQITISEQELSSMYNQAVSSVGSEQQYLEKISTIRAKNKEDVLKMMRIEILKSKIEKHTGLPFSEWIESYKKTIDIKRY